MSERGENKIEQKGNKNIMKRYQEEEKYTRGGNSLTE